MIRASLLAIAAVAALSPVSASAQQSVSFWLAAQPGNIQGCIAADPQFTREHVFTLNNGEAELTSAGGIKFKMKLTKPNTYEGDYQLGQLHLHYVADIAARTLDVSERNLGCKWTAKKV